ncbi:flavodoxin [Treponema sp. UBA3813]|uniref:flavodoxin n=1 Tax=Treponema sp. UBA3813 TaxID=1947715 RepID=UPI0025EBE6C4|nr:flavodoxin [Treponema sp. UBA3813]
MKTLIAYFSHTGENYFGGSIKNISKGNTEVVAEFAQKASGGDLFQIQTVKDYPVNYKECTEVAAAEGRAGERPALKGSLPSIADYDTIILGYPCWWGTMPQAVFTFLESGDFSGKKILPFCTHEGSGMGRSESDIKKLCPKAIVAKGLAVNGSSCHNAEASVKKWLEAN